MVVGIEARSELYLRFDSSGTENRDFTGKNVFHGSIVDFTGLPQKQPISRARDTVKKEGPCLPETPPSSVVSRVPLKKIYLHCGSQGLRALFNLLCVVDCYWSLFGLSLCISYLDIYTFELEYLENFGFC